MNGSPVLIPQKIRSQRQTAKKYGIPYVTAAAVADAEAKLRYARDRHSNQVSSFWFRPSILSMKWNLTAGSRK